MSGPEPALGEHWGYRARSTERLVEVEVLRIGTKRPTRVLIRFVDDAHEGREEWVPPSRLKVPWAGAAAWQKNDDRWQAARQASGPIRDSDEEHAAWIIFEALPRWEFAQPGMNRDAGLLVIADVDGLCRDLELAPEDLQHPAAFASGDSLIVPWPVTEVVLRRLAARNADAVLEAIRREEQRAKREARWGADHGGDTYISPEICAEVDAMYQPARELARLWCGEAAVERADELVALRDEVQRLGRLAEEAISALRERGATDLAKRLERELGIPVEVIRASQERQR